MLAFLCNMVAMVMVMLFLGNVVVTLMVIKAFFITLPLGKYHSLDWSRLDKPSSIILPLSTLMQWSDPGWWSHPSLRRTCTSGVARGMEEEQEPPHAEVEDPPSGRAPHQLEQACSAARGICSFCFSSSPSFLYEWKWSLLGKTKAYCHVWSLPGLVCTRTVMFLICLFVSYREANEHTAAHTYHILTYSRPSPESRCRAYGLLHNPPVFVLMSEEKSLWNSSVYKCS